jgi:hypothetical protein
VNMFDVSVSLPSHVLVASLVPVAEAPVYEPVMAVESQQSRPVDKLATVLKDLGADRWEVPLEVRNALVRLVTRKLDAFSAGDHDLGRTSLVMHEIDVGDARPSKQRVRRIPFGAAREFVEKETGKHLEAGVIRHSASPWSSPIVLAKQKGRDVRFCVDYRRLNAVTKHDAFPLPRLDETLERFAGADVFSSLDMRLAFHQVLVRPEDQQKTAFVTHQRLFEYVFMLFGACNAPATFQRLMSLVLSELVVRICLAYLDDVVVFSTGFEAHLERLETVFDSFILHGLKLKASKCKFL